MALLFSEKMETLNYNDIINVGDDDVLIISVCNIRSDLLNQHSGGIYIFDMCDSDELSDDRAEVSLHPGNAPKAFSKLMGRREEHKFYCLFAAALALLRSFLSCESFFKS